MSREGYGVEVCLDSLKRSGTPRCPHGPTLLFERYGPEAPSPRRRFYACSACRDRKDCNFFQWEDEKISEARKLAREKHNTSNQRISSHLEIYTRLKTFKKLDQDGRQFCMSCSLLLLPSEWEDHKNHQRKTDLTLEQLESPSTLLSPLENKKTNAQYLFSRDAARFTVSTLKKLGFKKVLCVGAPRIFEEIRSMKKVSDKDQMSSLLLDIDQRYRQFYSPKQFCRYNMFNHHFFDDDPSKEAYIHFMNESKAGPVVMVTDPPFGGLVEVLANNVQTIMAEWKEGNNYEEGKLLPVLWFFPYFMEPRILECFPSFNMLDYKVNYDNHTVFRGNAKKCKHGSPVRIFTNIPPSQMKLPAEEGYRFCKPCQRYVSAENVHCMKCKACTSKDGRTYVHCDKCERCVKPSRVHCVTCRQCLLQDHQCGQISITGCHICGDLSHKRKDCPNRAQRKRKTSSEITTGPEVKKPRKWYRKKKKKRAV